MENTLENKAKFFAQYWGQEVHAMKMSKKDVVTTVDEVSFRKDLSLDYLYLKPLSSITDKDAIALNFKDAKEFLNMSAFVQNGIAYFHELDLVRSMGYAVEYMGLSAEQQIKYGWIKLIDHENG